MRTVLRVLLVAVVAMFALGQGSCQNPNRSPTPNYGRPDQSGETPEGFETFRTWRYSRGAPDPAGFPCGTTYFTFGVVQDGVQCGAAFDFTPLVRQAETQRDALVPTVACIPACANRYVTVNSLINTCERGNTRARSRMEVGVTCSGAPIVPPPVSFAIPNPIPAGPSRQPVPPAVAPWPVNRTYEETLEQPPMPLGCNEEVKLEYRERAACTAPYNYAPHVQAAVVEAIKRHNALTCGPGCVRQPGPQITFTRWGCTNNDTEALVEIVFKSCVRGGN